MLKILCTGGGGAGSEALARLWRERYEMHFADADADAIAPSIAAERRHQIPMAGEQWVSALDALCRRLQIDVLIPTVDEELPLVPQLQAYLPGLTALLPEAGFVTLMKDKLASMLALAQAGLDAPRTQTIDRAAEIGFPCLVKPRDGRGSRGVSIVSDVEQLAAYRQHSNRRPDELLAQELLVGQEWTVYVSASRGRALRAIVPVCVNVKRGITIRAETVTHRGIEDYCARLHEKFATSGPFNVQLMETQDGRIAAFEVNPRVSTTLCLAVAAGADPIAEFFDARSARPPAPFKSGLRLRRFWFNHIGEDR